MFVLPWNRHSEKVIAARYPVWLMLHQVQVVHRHGPRTPLNYRLPDFYPFMWPLCGANLDNLRAGIDGPNVVVVGNEQDDLGHTRAAKVQFLQTSMKNCQLGQLTNLGISAMQNLGAELQKLYISSSRLQIGPENTYIRSTNYPRTIQSAYALYGGLFASRDTRSLQYIPAVNVHIKDPLIENIEGTSRCARYKKILRHFDTLVAQILEPETNRLKLEYPNLFQSNDIFGRPHSIYGIYETLTSYLSQGLPVPHNVDDKLINRLESYVTTEIYTAFRRSAEAIKFCSGRLVKEILENISVHGNEEKRLCIFSAHDTSLVPLLAAFGHHVDKNPPYCSAVAIELASDERDRVSARQIKPLYIRVLYNNNPVIIRHCMIPGNHHPSFMDGSLCTLEAFKEAVAQFVPRDYLAECNDLQSNVHGM